MESSILVAVDEADSAEEIAGMLRGFGYRVTETVATGAEAIRAVSSDPPSLVLIDVRLGGDIDGIATAAELRERFDVPAVYLTAFPDDATFARAKATEPYGYLIKPFTDRELRTTIEVALHKHELEAGMSRESWFSTEIPAIGEILLALDANGIVRFLSANGGEIAKVRAKDAIGKSIKDVFSIVASDGSPASSGSARALRRGFRVAVEESGGVATFDNVSDRMQLEKRLGVAERLVSVGTMAAGTAGEIDSPLTYVISNVSAATDRIATIRERLNEQASDGAAVEAELNDLGEILREASEGAERVRGIVHELHRFAGARRSAATLVDLPNVLDLAAQATAATVRARARLRREYGTTPFVAANEGELAQVFSNLLTNAADSIDEGAPEKNTIRIVTFTDDAGSAVVEIRDTGRGVPAQRLPHVFERSFTTRPFGEERGLGLSICRGIVTALRGKITMESTLGEGTCVRVVLPPTRPTQRSRASLRAPLPTSLGRRGRVLIVDDEPAVARSTARVLTRDHDVFVETDAARAVDRLLSDEVFDVVLCDLAMPGISGADLFETVSAAKPELASRFVFLTGGAFSREARAFLDGVPNVSLQKPFSIESLRKILRDYIR